MRNVRRIALLGGVAATLIAAQAQAETGVVATAVPAATAIQERLAQIGRAHV